MKELFRALAVQAAREAGTLLRENFRHGHSFQLKTGHRDLVTEFDRQAEAVIVRLIQKECPAHSILTEEASVRANKTASYQWIVDPLDGTTNFAHGFPFFAVSIALYERDEALIGVVYNPVHDELFVAEAGQGAWLNDERLSVSKTKTLRESLLMTGFPYDEHLARRHLVMWGCFAGRAQTLRRLGSSALALCYLAAGRADGYWGMDLKPWDMAAAVLIVREAGGRVTDLEGRPLDLYKGEVLATNGKTHKEMLAVLQSKGE